MTLYNSKVGIPQVYLNWDKPQTNYKPSIKGNKDLRMSYLTQMSMYRKLNVTINISNRNTKASTINRMSLKGTKINQIIIKIDLKDKT